METVVFQTLCGLFRPGQIQALPAAVAEWLVEHGIAKRYGEGFDPSGEQRGAGFGAARTGGR